jgi:hypothetical protein
LRRSTACCEPVPGSVKSLAVFVPIELDIANTPIAAAIHAETTIRRWFIVQRVSLSMTTVLH